ncbi:MAG TPA: hypothetical protein VJN44_17355 [Roseateles sp.]|nr:hypothetical protein [Roseateles sp.]
MAAAHRADVVVLSFGGHLASVQVGEALTELRAPAAAVELWAGGNGTALQHRDLPTGVTAVTGLAGVDTHLSRWCAAAPA